MKKILLIFAAILAMAANTAYAELTATPVTVQYPGYSPAAAMLVDEEGVAVLTPVVVYESGTDVEVVFLGDGAGDGIHDGKQFTLHDVLRGNESFAPDAVRLKGLWIESADLQSVMVSKNFFVKNNKWCVTFKHILADGHSEEFFVIDEDGNNLGVIPNLESNASPCIFLDGFYCGTPYLLASNENSEDGGFQLYTFTGSAGVVANKVTSITGAYPNPLPAGQTLTVSLDRAADNATFFTVTDMTGRQVYRHRVTPGENSFRLSGARFGHGRYVYTVIYGDGESVSGNLMAE